MAESINFAEEFTVNARGDVVIRALQDADSFFRFIDGVHDLKEIDPTSYEAMLETTIAYKKFRFRVVVQLARLQEPSEIEARIEGRPIGLIGRLSAKSLTLLNDPGSEHRPSCAPREGQTDGKTVC